MLIGEFAFRSDADKPNDISSQLINIVTKPLMPHKDFIRLPVDMVDYFYVSFQKSHHMRPKPLEVCFHAWF